VLVSLDTEAVLDALSLGIVVLDAQLCAVYANVLAEDMLALRLEKVRGRPLAAFLLQPQRFLDAVHRVLESGQAAEFQLHISDAMTPEPRGTVTSWISPIRDQVPGRYLLLQVSGCGRITPPASIGQ
jgi:PAS domain-containing protein